MKTLKKYTAVLVSTIIAVAMIPTTAQASGKAHVSLVPAVIVSVGSFHKGNVYKSPKSYQVKKRNNVYKTNYRANSNLRVKKGFTSKIVNSGRSFHLNSKKVGS